MKAANKQVIDDLQTGAQMLAHIAGQFKVDKINLNVMGLKWLAKRLCKWHHMTGHQLCIVTKRIFQFGEDPEYDAGTVSGADTVEEILTRAEELVTAAHDQFCEFRKATYEAKADYTSDIWEHAIQDLDHILTHVEREITLLTKTLHGAEAAYVGSRLDDSE
jgi:hypothetical protein